ncbi:glycosyltransferase family 4 protein [Bradyrhizobium huanghuaihaiense]|uniref:glycosyltransferase family 4 protein n=1 Tax=Bradyrhizobium huanghuaihaiense TaxID=990078 RepID=UPI0021AAFCD3|nr:glycosyltransferase family 4 protein [Bradyrhizobium sp. CB3035]UWU74818.1 glycosyltransferase family 4 protein [Bradyrhizobium sp. CB3035]
MSNSINAEFNMQLISGPSKKPSPSVSNRMPTVLYLINQYPAISHTFIKREVLALERLGVAVVRVAARGGKELVDPGDLAEEKRTIYLLQRPFALLRATISSLLLRPRGFGKALLTTLRMMRRSDRGPLLHAFYFVEACGVASIARDAGATHLHAHFGTNPAELALIASHLSGLSYSFTVHGCGEFDKPEFLALEAKIEAAAFVVAVSYYGRAQLYRWCKLSDCWKIKLIRCGIDEQFQAMSEVERCEAPRFVCVARFSREKGLDILIKAAAAMVANGHKFEVIIVGDGEGRKEFEILVAALGLSGTVRLRGWLNNADVRREIIGARALVVSSLAENLPIVIMEAMALRRPVVATQIAGIPELVIPRETGWLAAAGAPEALAAAMTECLLAPREQLEAMGRKGRERVLALHDVDREAAGLADLFATSVSQQNDIVIAEDRHLSAAVR